MTNSEYFHPPRAAEILRAIVRAFEMRHPALRDKTAQRYFSKGDVSEEAKAYILRAFCEELVDHRVFPDPIGEVTTLENRDEVVIILLTYVTRTVDDWESLLSSVRSIAPRVEQTDLATYVIARLVTIDLALRNAALLAVRGSDGGAFEVPAWAKIDGLRNLLRDMHDACDLDRPSRLKISDKLSADRHTVDNWFDGRSVPSIDYLKGLAKIFGDHTSGSDGTEITRRLIRIMALSKLAASLRSVIGNARFERLAERYQTYTREAYRHIRPSPLRVSDPPVDPGRLLLWGSQLEDSDYLLEKLSEFEDDPLWQADLAGISEHWLVRILQTFHSLRHRQVSAKFVVDDLGVNPEYSELVTERINELGQVNLIFKDVEADIPSEARWMFAEMATLGGESEIAIAHMERLINENPEHPGYHQHLGFALEQVGRVEDAIAEYQLSLVLDPTDPNPLTFIGMAEYYSGNLDGAVKYLNQAIDRIGNEDETLNLYLGMSLRESGEFCSALETFERMVKHNPKNAWAADWAADCAFKVGDRIKAQRYARMGWRDGQGATYQDWRSGRV